MAKRFKTAYGWAGGSKRAERTYLGHNIRGNPHEGWRAYVMGEDLYSKTLEGIKDKIHLAERGFRRSKPRSKKK